MIYLLEFTLITSQIRSAGSLYNLHSTLLSHVSVVNTVKTLKYKNFHLDRSVLLRMYVCKQVMLTIIPEPDFTVVDYTA